MGVDNTNNCNIIVHSISVYGYRYSYLHILTSNLDYIKGWTYDTSGLIYSKKRMIWMGTSSFFTLAMSTGITSPTY